ncbi:methyltransferase [Kocuria sediminis]|uniref:Methyltransferase n=1 Tax=Kocuria sediminis TaxID=1038857 RepID=A0A6N8GMN0_9MICC|nr:methyltransferase [Kocuria sediminis]MUN62205.1 methyltransferase [Kocuria sediminis]
MVPDAPGRPPAFSRVPGTPVSDDPRRLAALHGALRGSGFTHNRVAGLLGAAAMDALARDQAVPALRVLEPVLGTPGHPDRGTAGLVVLFLLGRAVPAEVLAASAVAPGDLVGLGLAEQTRDGLRSTVDLRPHAADDGTELYVASDLGESQRPGVLRRDHVLGIGQASLTLAQTTDRRPVGRALDVGTGCGIQTFHLLAHARHVTATDLSDRALGFTRFNLLLNAQALALDPQRLEDRVSLRAGSLLEPVAGERFDLVVSNPPFVITPRAPGETPADRFTYRDGGLPGDRIVADLVRALPGVMAPGATAHLLGNWEVLGAEDTGGAPVPVAERWMRRPESWVPEGIDTWWIQRELAGPEEYAETWLRDAAESRDPEHYERAYRAYLDDFAARGVEAVGFGMIRLRRPSAPRPPGGALRRFEHVPHPVQQPLAPALAATWARADWLAAHPEDWLDAHLVAAEDVTEERHQRPGAEHPGVILLRQGAGLRRTTVLTSEAAGFAGACDGELSARQILAALAALLEWTGDERERLADEVRHLVLDGFLVPLEQPPAPTDVGG